MGTARRTWRHGPAPEPLSMWEEVARAAIEDVASGRVLAGLDHLAVVHCLSWTYDEPATRLAERLGLSGASLSNSILAGTSPQRMIDEAAARMVRGQCSAALVVGAEAAATLRLYREAGEEPPWSFPHPHPQDTMSSLAEWYTPTEVRHGILPAWLTFALLEQARWAARGGTEADRAALAAQMAELSRVATANPDAWFHRDWTAGDLINGGAANRRVVTPYTKAMTAFPTVDMAAANVLATVEQADAWGVPEDRRVHLRGSAFARDASHIAGRDDLASSAAMRRTASAALSAAGLELGQIDAFDLYSCFGAAVFFARDALGLTPADPRPVTLTGGLPYHGGPGSNYMGHSISHAVEAIRRGEYTNVMVTGVGMHMTKHVAAVWSAEPGPVGDEDFAPQQAAVAGDPVEVAEEGRGPARLEAATVVFDRSDQPEYAVGIARLGDGRRCYTRTTRPEVLDAVAEGKWLGATALLSEGSGGTNDFTL